MKVFKDNGFYPCDYSEWSCPISMTKSYVWEKISKGFYKLWFANADGREMRASVEQVNSHKWEVKLGYDAYVHFKSLTEAVTHICNLIEE